MKFKDFELSKYEQVYLTSVAVPRYVRETGKSPAQIWFELFIEHLESKGFEVVKAGQDLKEKK